MHLYDQRQTKKKFPNGEKSTWGKGPPFEVTHAGGNLTCGRYIATNIPIPWTMNKIKNFLK